MYKDKGNLIFAAILHLFVDFVCIMMVWNSLKLTEGVVLNLIYTVLAFGTQELIGYYLDVSKNKWVGVIGAIIVGITGIMPIPPLVAIILAGIGNSMFHVGASLLVIYESRGRLTDLGIYVSTGAIGVGLGKLINSRLAGVILLIISFIWSYRLRLYNETYKVNDCNWDIAIKEKDILFVVCIAISGVIIRAAGGGEQPLYSINGALGVMLLSISACAGKALGGILGDKFGARTTGVSAMVLSIIFYGSSYITKSLGILSGTIAFNAAMPITLGVVIDKLKGFECFGFGLTTLGLLIGTIVPILHLNDKIISMILYSVCAMLCICGTTKNRDIKEQTNV